MDATTNQSQAETALARQFASASDALPGGADVKRLRETSFAEFQAAGLPTRRVEDWKYTNLRTLMPDASPQATRPDAAALARAETLLKAQGLPAARRLTLVDGYFAASLSDLNALEKGVTIRPLAQALDDKAVVGALSGWVKDADPMLALNAALMTDGVVIDVAANSEIERPLQIAHVVTGAKPTSTMTRSLVRIGANTKVTLVESFVGHPSAYQVNDALIVEAGDGVNLQHVRLMEDADAAINISMLLVRLGRDVTFNTFSLTSGCAISRHQIAIGAMGEGASVTTNGVNLLKGAQHGDTTLLMDHAVPNCMSREVFRAVLDNRAKSIFQGKIVVRPDAQKTDAKMMTRALLLSDDAEADNKPELEIFADDVTCGHGATAGALDSSLLFYLRARGLPEKEAQSLLIQAFVGEAIESIVNDDLRDAAIGAAERWLATRG
jgi:Fe-S cluster assembly protein SufD